MNEQVLLYNNRPDHEGGVEPLLICQTEEVATRVIEEMEAELNSVILSRPKGIKRKEYLNSLQWRYVDLSSLLPFRFPSKIPDGIWGIEKMSLPFAS